MVSPGEFIPLAEETGLIVPLGAWVIEEACRQAVLWNEGGGELAGCLMSVNVSGRQLVEPGLADSVSSILDRTGLDPAQLCLEVTESVLVENVEQTAPVLRSLRAIGVKFAVDDFGTGYSSLASLQRFPIDLLKIDRSFVTRLPDEEDAGTIVWAVVRLAHNLHLRVVAEGVETPEQLAALKQYGCDIAQGYLFSKPVPGDELS
jgi:EAL domain-containing protein (putative c-di-GMP-specific phosphodiesterase class I)